jgi:DNA-binding NarL/FixJ family response regulator
MTAQIFIVEDHPAVRRGYMALLQREPDLTVCGEAASGEEALRLIPYLHPDLVLVDLSLPQMNGLTLIAHLYQTQPTLPVLIVSSHEPKAFTLLYNIKEYIHKDTAPQRLVPTIQQVLAT